MMPRRQQQIEYIPVLSSPFTNQESLRTPSARSWELFLLPLKNWERISAASWNDMGELSVSFKFKQGDKKEKMEHNDRQQ